MPSSRVSGSLVIALFAAAAVVSASRLALAQDERTTAMARDLFRQGVELADHEQWPDARDRFERAYQLRRTPVIGFNLATVCVHLGLLVEAVERFEEVRRDESANADAREASEERLAALRPRLARLTVRVAGPRADTTFTLDGRTLPEALVGVQAPADPGHHVVVASRGGAEVARAEGDVAEGAEAAMTIEVPVAPPTPADVARHDGVGGRETGPHTVASGDATWLWVGIGAGVLAVAVGVIIAVVLVTQPTTPLPIGDSNPGTLRW